MRIIIPNISYPDNFEDNVSYTLRKMGHEVWTMPKPIRLLNDKARHVLTQFTDRLTPNAWTIQEKWLFKSIRSLKPDIVLCLTQALNEEVLLQLKQENITTICWWGDTAANMTKQGLLCNGWDFVYIKDKYAVQKLRSLDINAYYLHEAMNPDWHKKISERAENAIIFAGNTYDYRHYLLRKLILSKKFEIKLYGNRPPRWAHESIQNVYQHKYIVKEEKSAVFGRGAACINSTSMTEFDSINCRAFEIAGAGGLQIMEYRPTLEECFEPGREILTFKSFEELEGILDKCINGKNEYQKIRNGSYKRAHADHTYSQRLNHILQALS